MAEEPTPAAVVDMDPNYQGRMSDLRADAAAEYAARPRGGQVTWDRPSGWSGDVFDLAAPHTPFDRDKANQAAVRAIDDPSRPGVTGDTVVATTMIDTLASAERAFRNRHTMRRPRAMAHLLGRKKGHGATDGVFGRNGIEYVRDMLKQARAPQ